MQIHSIQYREVNYISVEDLYGNGRVTVAVPYGDDITVRYGGGVAPAVLCGADVAAVRAG
jgi:hypothetical protein